MTMRALKTLEERRDAALDVARFLARNGAGLSDKYPTGSSFTAIGISDNGDAVMHVELPDRTDAVERIPAENLRYLRPITAAATQADAIDAATAAEPPLISIARQEDGSYYVIRRTGSTKSKRWKTNVTIVRLGGSVQTGHPDAPARDV